MPVSRAEPALAIASPVAPRDATRVRARRARISPAWPATALIAGYPLLWLAGVGAFAWIVLPIVMALALASRRTVLLPRGFALWALFCLWMLLSAVQIDSAGRMAAFGLRAGYYLGAGVFLVFAMNGGRDLGVAKILRLFGILWLGTVVGGLLGVVAPNVSYASPLLAVLPGFIRSNDFFVELTTTGFAEVQNVVGVTIPRPRAPYPYTNSWGAAVGLLMPLVIAALAVERGRVMRRLLLVSIPLAAIPVVLSLNRGLWISLAVGLLYVSLRQARRGNGQVIAAMVFVVLAAVALVLYTPIGAQVRGSLETRAEDSDATRTALISEAVSRTVDSPLLGYGGPRDSVNSAAAVPVGTHGQLWALLFSHGFVATGLYLGFFALAFYRTRNPRTAVGLWAHAVIVVAGLQMLFYGQLPYQLFILMGAVAVCLREGELVAADAAAL